MGCPQCKSDEISPSGVCLICGYQLTTEPSPTEAKPAEEEKEESGYSGAIEMDYAEGPPEAPEKNELPQWRQELSQRLNEIKQKRDSGPSRTEARAQAVPGPRAKPVESLSVLQARLLERTPVRKPQPPLVPPPRQKTLEPVSAEPVPAKAPAEQRDIRNLIDNAVSKQMPQPTAQSATAMRSHREPEPVPDEEGKLILLSRTLSGLVDLIVVVLCTGLFIIAADFFSGIIVLDRISLIDFSLLFLLNYFLYSFFFLFAANQTIGMMITDLRVVGPGDSRPTLGQLLRRCCGHLISLFGLGIGLLLGLFDRQSLCFHDRSSGTHVIRN